MKRLVLLLSFSLPAAAAVFQQDGADQTWDSPTAIIPKRMSVEVKDQVEISADTPGIITYLEPSERGKLVTKGAEVVRLDSSLVEAQLAEANARAESEVLIDYAQKALDAATNKLESKRTRNARSLKETGVTVFSEDEIRQLELETIKAQAELNKAREDQRFAKLNAAIKAVELAKYKISAGAGGIVTDTHKKSVGSAVRQGDPILTIVDLTEVYAKLLVNPADEGRINIGDKVLVRRRTVAPAPGRSRRISDGNSATKPAVTPAAMKDEQVHTFEGVISHIGKDEFGKDNLVEVWAVVQNVEVVPGKFLLREGSFIDARILSP